MPSTRSSKRKASPELVARRSDFSTSVTLFEAPASSSTVETATRRSKRVKVKTEDTSDEPVPLELNAAQAETETKVVKTETTTRTTKPRSMKNVSPKKAKPIPQALAVPHPAPERWKDAYDTIKDMRTRIVAPVDTMGCDQAQYGETDPKNRRFATLVSLMLSSQTKDAVTDAAVKQLRANVGGSLSIEAVLQAPESAISEAIAKVGFWRRKTQYIRQAAQKLQDEFDGDVPKTVDKLCSLPGVGPKMAFLALQTAWNINAGIGVDVHVHRITNRLGWHKPPTKTPEETRLNLQSWLPSELHGEINHMLVGFGQTVCVPVGPKCGECELSDGRCPSAKKGTKRTQKKTVTTTASAAGPKIEITLEESVSEAIAPASPMPDDEDT